MYRGGGRKHSIKLQLSMDNLICLSIVRVQVYIFYIVQNVCFRKGIHKKTSNGERKPNNNT